MGKRWSRSPLGRLGRSCHTASMRDQYYCHFDFVRFRAPNKVSWNLDLGRPAYDYWTLIQRQCN